MPLVCILIVSFALVHAQRSQPEPIGVFMKFRIVGTILAFAASTQLLAATPQIERRYTPALKRCIDNSGYGDAAMTECYDIELSVQDGRLNQAYKMVMLRLSAARKTALRNEERAWIKRRDAVCQRHAAPEAGGTMYDVMLSSCMVDETIKRTIVLENY